MAAVGLFASGVAIGRATSRTIWAIARDGVLPFSNVWATVSPVWEVPALAMVFTAVVTTLYGTIFIGSANVFSSMISARIIFFLASCAIPPAIVLYRGCDNVLPERYFRTPAPWGTLVKATSMAWCAFVIVPECYPVFYPITSENLRGMNWISVLTVFLVVVILAMWFVRKRRTFHGPKVDSEKMQMRRKVLRDKFNSFLPQPLFSGQGSRRQCRVLASHMCRVLITIRQLNHSTTAQQ
ncbi:Putative amino acid/polyamine transporter I [Septoria linicola]|uniref:Amino acid/polyamine transporter I n=1 Tax=Septoria linicola TaxID=215465 RepID=A0A9Q9B8Y4_9PEZI|nr:Putative amino acid/polyamine transporter I [Septoria linicola]